MEQKIIGHPIHPSCTLWLKDDGGSFVCAACKSGSSGIYRYRCDSCKFNFHGHCVTSPASFPFWGHPHHPLTLVSSRPDLAGVIRSSRPDLANTLVESFRAADERIPVYCDICTNEIEGMHYQCLPCGVFLHPVCVQLPYVVQSTAHPEHELTLICTFPTMCIACQTPSTWAYRCFRCLVPLHANCIPEHRDLLGCTFRTAGSDDVPTSCTRQFGRIIGAPPPPPPRGFVGRGDPFASVNPLGFRDIISMPRPSPSATPSVVPNPFGGAFPFSGEYGRATFGQGP